MDGRFEAGNKRGVRFGAMPEALRCKATTRASKRAGDPCQCRNAAIKGKGLCRMHGGHGRVRKAPTRAGLLRLAARLRGEGYSR